MKCPALLSRTQHKRACRGPADPCSQPGSCTSRSRGGPCFRRAWGSPARCRSSWSWGRAGRSCWQSCRSSPRGRRRAVGWSFNWENSIYLSPRQVRQVEAKVTQLEQIKLHVGQFIEELSSYVPTGQLQVGELILFPLHLMQLLAEPEHSVHCELHVGQYCD